LPLLELWVFLIDHVELALTPDDLAVDATLFDRGFDFHIRLVVWAFVCLTVG
jgi:hypothetical protein